jgi:hypothetical protein
MRYSGGHPKFRERCEAVVADIVSCRWLRRDNGGQARQPAVA